MKEEDRSIDLEGAKLVQLYLAGEAGEEEGDQLYELTRRLTLPRLQRMCAGTSVEAEEILHEAFGRALESLSTLKEAERFFFWFRKIARNEFLRAVKRKRESPLETSSPTPDYQPDQEQQTLLEEVRRFLSQYENRRDAQIFLYRWGDLCGGSNHTLEETAKHFSLSPARVHQIMRKVARWIQKILDD